MTDLMTDVAAKDADAVFAVSTIDVIDVVTDAADAVFGNKKTLA